MEKPEITILLAAHNGAAYIREMVDSVMAQSCRNFLLVLSDDGSEDETREILRSYASANPGTILYYDSKLRFGNAQKHFLHLLKKFHDTPYIMFCDQDDVWHTDKVEKTLRFMRSLEQNTEEPVLVHTDLRVVDRDLKEIAPSFIEYSRLHGDRLKLNELLVQNVVTGCTVMINHALAELVCCHEAGDAILMHDWWLALAASAFGRIGFLREPTMDYRQHGGNTVGAKGFASMSWQLSKLRNNEIHRVFVQTTEQAAEFEKVFRPMLSNEQARMLRDFANAPKEGKPGRIRLYCRYNLWKDNFLRKFAQIAWW